MIPLILVGCKTIEHRTPSPNEFVIIDPERSPPLVMEDFKWEVWDKNRIIEESQKENNTNDIVYVLFPDQLEKLLDNIIKVSDAYSKEREINKYYRKSINEYRKSIKAEVEENER